MNTMDPHALVVPSYFFLAFRIAAAVRIVLAPVYALADVVQVVESTSQYVVWALWLRLCETRAMEAAAMRWLVGGSAFDVKSAGGLREQRNRTEGTVEKNGAERVRLMEEGRGCLS